MRRFTRSKTIGYSRKAEYYEHAVALNFLFRNFAMPHSTLTELEGERTTPATTAGLEDRVWSMLEIAEPLVGDYRMAV